MQLNLIANTRVPSASGRTLAVVDPSDGQPFDEIQRSSPHDIDQAVAAARDGFDGVWRNVEPTERGRLLLRLADAVTAHAGELAVMLQRDVGTPTRHATAEVTRLARCFARYAAACGKLGAEPAPRHDGYRLQCWREPLGVTSHIIPWYAPLQTFGRGVGAALAAGNVCVVKPAEEASLALLRVAELAAEAGFPAGALNVVTGHDQETAEALARHLGVDHLSLAGSRRLALLVQQAAAERQCPVRLAPRGNRPHIVFADADLGAALPAIVRALLHSASDTGSAGVRLLIERAVYEPLLERLAAAFEALRVGPAHLDLDMGPLIRQSHQQHVWDFLSDAHVAGISMVAQGMVMDDAPETGFYQAPTLLRDVPQAHALALALDDLPGPVLAAMPFDDEVQAVAMADATGLTAATCLWTRDESRQLRLGRSLRSARVTVNAGHAASPSAHPHGAAPRADEAAFEALLRFTRLKTLAIRQE